MTRKSILALGSAALLSLGVIGGTATMAGGGQNEESSDAAEAQAFLAAPGTISDAIVAAESQTGGKAISAEFESGAEVGGMYDIEIVLPDGKMVATIVDPADGSVKMVDTSATGDDDEGDDNGDDDDSDDDS